MADEAREKFEAWAATRDRVWMNCQWAERGGPMEDAFTAGYEAQSAKIVKLEDQLKVRDKCSFKGAMRDCPTHGESTKIVELTQRLEEEYAADKEIQVLVEKQHNDLEQAEAKIEKLEEALRTARDIVHCSHSGSVNNCEWTLCKNVNGLLSDSQKPAPEEI